MIFAAGFGTRMMPLTQDRPKPMVPLGGAPMIDHAIDYAKHAGAKTIVANTHYKANLLEQYLAKFEVVTIRETPNILDTGGGFRNARHLLPEAPVWTMNCDAVWNGPNPLNFIAKHWNGAEMDALLLCIEPSKARGTKSAGDFSIAETGRLARGAGVIYGGIQIINPAIFDCDFPEVFSMNLIWDQLIDKGRCHGVVYPGTWCDIGTPEGLEIAETLLGEPPHVQQ